MAVLEDQIRAALDRVLVSLSGQLESELTASAADILRATSEARERAAAEASERATSDTRREAEVQLAFVQREFDRQRDELQGGHATELANLQRALDEERAALSAARVEVDERREQRDALQRELDEVRLAADTSRRESDDRRLRIEEIEGQIDGLRRFSEEQQQNAEASGRLLGEVQLRLAGAEEERERARREVERSSDLLTALQTLDGCGGLTDVLDALTRLAAKEAGRAAVCLVSGSSMKAWRAVGFPESVVGLQLDVEQDGLLGNAVTSGRQDYHHGNGSALPAFAASEFRGPAVALPVKVGGSVIAVLYADAAITDTPDDLQWTTRVEILTRYAGRMLEAMTVRQAAALWTPKTPLRTSGARRSAAAGRRE